MVFFVAVVSRAAPLAEAILALAARQIREAAEELRLMAGRKYILLPSRQAAGTASQPAVCLELI